MAPLPAGRQLNLAQQVVAAGQASGRTVAVAESLTGGLVLAALTAVPGASSVVRGGVVAYAVDVKRDLLGVPEQVLRAHGAVSEATARAMAAAAVRRLGADWGLSTTGVAGPAGSEGRPPGTVHIAVQGPGGDQEEARAHRALTLHGTREQVRESTVREGLLLLLQTWSRGDPRHAVRWAGYGGPIEVPPGQ